MWVRTIGDGCHCQRNCLVWIDAVIHWNASCGKLLRSKATLSTVSESRQIGNMVEKISSTVISLRVIILHLFCCFSLLQILLQQAVISPTTLPCYVSLQCISFNALPQALSLWSYEWTKGFFQLTWTANTSTPNSSHRVAEIFIYT